ncbi:hypothetical protein [Pseudofrankia sp. BMG5.37]|uniref:hypothetical protein n=1 Tax=Pseudofrankia sp. BMG5.37 TaxID=3050035 RepID=UPI002895B82D|nr:hypothetical protein [Pseudofrankia sp. BMG5.37]MDT3444491.1 hypothetical protein [Pseudofrankia sp. BMG5.37]
MSSVPPADMPVFAGAGDLVILVQDLVRRPPRGEAPCVLRGETHARLGIPVVSIVDRHRLDLLPHLARRLNEAYPYRVPHSLYPIPADSAAGEHHIAGVSETDQLLRLLDGLRSGLGAELSRDAGRIRFRRYGLVRWLVAQNLDDDEAEPDHLLVRRLRERSLARKKWLAASGEQTDLGSPTLNLVGRLLLHLSPLLWFRLKIAGRLPGRVGAEFRWLRRQEKYLASRDPGTVLGFAERLCGPRRHNEDADEVLRFVVHTFLEDLRDAYRRRPWRLRAWRRTAYAVALLDGVSDTNVGSRFVELINDVRNDTGAFDPLLVVAKGVTVPPRLRDCGPMHPAAPASADDCVVAYRDWIARFPEDSRRRSPAAWYLAIVVPRALSHPDSPQGGEPAQDALYVTHRRALGRVRRIEIDRPPRWCRRWAVAAIATTVSLSVLVGVGMGLLVWKQAESAWRAEHCGLKRSHPDAATLVTAGPAGTECIGLSEHAYTFSAGTEPLAAAQRTIHKLNQQADEAHAANPRRPFVTLVYMQVMTSATDRADTLASEREQLLGAAAAQQRQLKKRNDADPIFRLLIANAGRDMLHGPRVARMLPDYRPDGAPVVGVLGLDQSRQPTVDTIKALTQLGIPMVAATLSADELVRESQMYFQVSPPNSREAAVAAAFADGVLLPSGQWPPQARHALVLYSADSDDTYSRNLRDDARTSFDALGIKAVEQPFRPNGALGDSIDTALSVTEAGQRLACGFDGVVFFAGRTEDFPTLLDGITRNCQSRPPILLAGDDVSRYAASADLRAGHPGVEFYYLTFATRSQPCDPSSSLYQTMSELFPADCRRSADASLDGHAALAYDAALIVLQAVQSLADHRIPLGPAAVWRGLGTIHGDLHIDGESGLIDFGAGGSQAPVDKFVAVMKIDGVGEPTEVSSCGRARGKTPSEWCPRTEPE